MTNFQQPCHLRGGHRHHHMGATQGATLKMQNPALAILLQPCDLHALPDIQPGPQRLGNSRHPRHAD